MPDAETMMTRLSDLFAEIPAELSAEVFETLLETPSFRIERIVSLGHASPEASWYDQETHEWILLLSGAARLLFDGEGTLDLRTGSFINIPAHKRHRVEWTDPGRPTIWLAIHYAACLPGGAEDASPPRRDPPC
jgi:cupin 2 domain-containing protein